jgi:hypothetical protein
LYRARVTIIDRFSHHARPPVFDIGQRPSYFQSQFKPILSPLDSNPAGDMAPAGQFAIDILFDEVLLEIFDCYVEETQYSQGKDGWHTLACVCRRWRSIAFGSPHRLNLRIFCSDTGRIPVSLRKKLDFWPPFPIVLTVNGYREPGEDNILATLEHHDRVCDIDIWGISRSLWEKALPLMQKPFPILTDLNLSYADRMTASVIPDSFLGGSAPQLRKLKLVYSTFHFRGYRNHFCPPLTSSILNFIKFPIPNTFQPTR